MRIREDGAGFADAFDALTHVRPYKEAWSMSEAMVEIKQESGWQFDPRIVDALVRVMGRETFGVAVLHSSLMDDASSAR